MAQTNGNARYWPLKLAVWIERLDSSEKGGGESYEKERRQQLEVAHDFHRSLRVLVVVVVVTAVAVVFSR